MVSGEGFSLEQILSGGLINTKRCLGIIHLNLDKHMSLMVKAISGHLPNYRTTCVPNKYVVYSIRYLPSKYTIKYIFSSKLKLKANYLLKIKLKLWFNYYLIMK